MLFNFITQELERDKIKKLRKNILLTAILIQGLVGL